MGKNIKCLTSTCKQCHQSFDYSKDCRGFFCSRRCYYDSFDPHKRFFKKIKVGKPNQCWEWIAKSRTHGGYGFFRFNGNNVHAHRYSWLIHKGKIPPHKWVLHTCDNPSCVNPRHLYIGTARDNSRDIDLRGRRRVGSVLTWSKLTEHDVSVIRSTYSGRYGELSRFAKYYQVSIPTIWSVVNKKTWKHVISHREHKIPNV